MKALAAAFTRPTAERFLILLFAAILTTGCRTILNLLRTVNHLAPGHPSSYHRVFSQRCWSLWRLGRALAGYILTRWIPAGMVVFSADYKWLALTAVSAKGLAVATECLARGTKAALLGQKPLTMGQALAGGLRAGLLGANVPVWLNSPLTDLHLENGTVTGVVVTRNGSAGLVRARGRARAGRSSARTRGC